MHIETGTWHDTLEYAAASDIGMRRGNNQDAYVIAPAGSPAQWRRCGHLLAVADGMGAHAAGELASQMAAENVPHTYYKLGRLSPAVALRRAVIEANRLIHLKGEGSVDFHGMGTTCSTLLLTPQGAIVAHVGDSRIYRLRDGVFEQLTFDHSLVWEMAEAGHVTEDKVPKFIPKNVITRSLGPHVTVDVDLEGPFPLREGDCFLLCSDGLTGPVSDIEIGSILNCLSPEETVRTLVDVANLRGGPDNITVVVARVRHTTTPGEMANANVGQLTEAADTIRGSVHPIVWGVISALLVVALTCIALGQGFAAGASGVGLLFAILVAILQRMDKPRTVEPVAGPLGRGPHRTFDCHATQEMIDVLVNITDELHTVAETLGKKIDAGPFEAHRAQARTAAKEENLCQGIRDYCTAIRLIMQQIQEQRGGDSSIL